MIKSVKELRKEGFVSVEGRPGVYTWWFRANAVDMLLKPLGKVDKSRLLCKNIKGEKYLALYFGVAKNCCQRAAWHMNQHHTVAAVKSSFLSTLRHTLSALLKKNISLSEEAVNQFMDDNCEWEWQYTASKEEAEEIEKQQLKLKYYPLNIKGNQCVPKEFIKTLKSLRKKYKR